jgi:FKBP-type peptidyl-prolyl cis-trans isomerase FkpA
MSTTAVPIPPTSNSGKIALWVGVAALAVIGGGLAWQGTAAVNDRGCGGDAFLPTGGAIGAVTTLESGARFQVIRAGKGASPTDSDIAFLSIKGKTPDGVEIINQPQLPIPVADTQVPGLSAALKKMQGEGSYRLCIPAKPGAKPPTQPGQPNQAMAMRLEVDMLGFQNRVAVEQQMRAMQQAHGGAGAGAAPPPGMPAQ